MSPVDRYNFSNQPAVPGLNPDKALYFLKMTHNIFFTIQIKTNDNIIIGSWSLNCDTGQESKINKEALVGPFFTKNCVAWDVKEDVLEDLNAAGEPALHAEDGIVDQRKVDRLRTAKISLPSDQFFVLECDV